MLLEPVLARWQARLLFRDHREPVFYFPHRAHRLLAASIAQPVLALRPYRPIVDLLLPFGIGVLAYSLPLFALP